MYWEELYETFEYASNLDAIELNRDMKFNFILHAGSKEVADSWEDLKIPFPHPDWEEPSIVADIEKLRGKVNISQKKADPKRQARMDAVRKRIAEHKNKMQDWKKKK